MKHDDASSNSDLAIERVQSPTGALAVKQDFQARQAFAEDSRLLSSLVVDNFLPSPNRLLVFGSLGLVGALGLGALASTLVTHRTTVKVQSVVEPVGDVQVIRSSVEGVIDSIFVEEHELLEPGQVIASFENSPLQTKVSQIETQIASTKERIAQINGQLKALERQRMAESAWLQQLTIAGLGVGNSLQQFEYSKGLLLNYKDDLKAQMRKERRQLENVQKQMDELEIRSPQAGHVYDLAINDEGQAVDADEIIAKIVSDEVELELKALVSNLKVKNVKVGYPAEMDLPSCAPLRFGSLPGEVSAVEPVQPGAEDGKDILNKNIPEKAYMVTVKTKTETLQGDSHTCELLPGMEGELTIVAKQERLLNFLLRKLRLKINI